MPCKSEPWSHQLDCPKGGCVCGQEPNLFVATNVSKISVGALKAALKEKQGRKKLAARSSMAANERARLAQKAIDRFSAEAMAAVGERCAGEKVAVIFEERDNVETMLVKYKNLKSRIEAWLRKCRPIPKEMKWLMKGRILYSYHTH